ncbi:MAG: MFS transporter [Candidatus Sericytochromatia bacterium]|nr:MFS transporter [Candidatus Sericytochromatia bacterium]
MSHTTELLAARRFAPLFWAQFLGSFNDNVLKQAIVIMVTFQGIVVWGIRPEQMGTFATALLVLPFFLFSALAGQIADKFPKTLLVKRYKLLEVGLMAFAAAGFILDSPAMLLAVLFLLGSQSAFFGPLKYSALPQYLKEEELVTGNALVEGGTNLSILLGGVAGGLLISISQPLWGGLVSVGVAGLSLLLLGCSVVGWLATRWLPVVPASAPDLSLNWNPLKTTWGICYGVAQDKGLFNSILGISWLWTFGFAFLGLMTPWVKGALRADEGVATLFLALFSIGVGVGSLLCERLSFNKLELGLVPLGSLGVSLFTLDLAFAATRAAEIAPLGGQGVSQLLLQAANWRVVADLLLISIFAGFFLVPLYTCLQLWAQPAERSRVIAANNIINSLFIVVYAPIQIYLIGLTTGGPLPFLGFTLTIPHLFALMALVNVVVAIHIYRLIPEFTLRFVAYLLTRAAYRLRVTRGDRIPDSGAALLICNHVTYVDWLFIGGAIRRPVRFVMWAGFAQHPLMKALVKDAKIIPIYPSKEDPETLAKALDQIAEELSAGELVCIFPEGKLTPDGNLCEFRTGVERIVARTPVPVIPMALKGLWGSYFSLVEGQPLRRPFRRGFWSPVELLVSDPVVPGQVTAAGLREIVANLLGNERVSTIPVTPADERMPASRVDDTPA